MVLWVETPAMAPAIEPGVSSFSSALDPAAKVTLCPAATPPISSELPLPSVRLPPPVTAPPILSAPAAAIAPAFCTAPVIVPVPDRVLPPPA